MPKSSRFVVLAVSLVVLLTWSQSVSSLPQGNSKQSENGARHLNKPVSFDSAEADRILAALQVFPPDNPWNEDVSQRPLAPNSQAIIASIGADNPLDFNLDMNFVLVPPNQLTPALQIEPSSHGFMFGQDMYFVGFPYGLFTSVGHSVNT